MAEYIKLYVKYCSDIFKIKRLLVETMNELEVKLVEGEDNLDYPDIKEHVT